MNLILNEYATNREYYTELISTVSSTIDGRCCHHHVVILAIITRIFNIKTYLEIGVHNGTSMSYVVSQTPGPSLSIGIDLFESTIQRYKHDKLMQQRTLKNILTLNRAGADVRLIKGNSRSLETVEQCKRELGETPLDLLFIDGDHEYAGVSSDFLLYSPLVRPGGFIVFDDVNNQYPDILKCIEKHVKTSPSYEIICLFEECDLVIRKVA